MNDSKTIYNDNTTFYFMFEILEKNLLECLRGPFLLGERAKKIDRTIVKNEIANKKNGWFSADLSSFDGRIREK